MCPNACAQRAVGRYQQLAKSVGAQSAGPAMAAERMQSLRLLCALTTENFRLELEAPSAPVATPARPPLLYGGVDVDVLLQRVRDVCCLTRVPRVGPGSRLGRWAFPLPGNRRGWALWTWTPGRMARA